MRRLQRHTDTVPRLGPGEKGEERRDKRQETRDKKEETREKRQERKEKREETQTHGT
jgi:hypothetical protein